MASELESLLPGGRLRPGSIVSVGQDLPLLLALAARAATEAGPWAVVGLPQLGVLAAGSMGLDVGAGLWVDRPGKRWPEVVTTLAESVPVLLLGPLGPAPGRQGRRLAAVLRRTGAVLLTTGAWEGADLRMAVTASRWEGVGAGHGLLRARRVRVSATGRGAAGGAPRTVQLWLPGSEGRACPFENTPDLADAPVEAPLPAPSEARRGLHVVG
ncbi:hypothetical protein PV682_32265 [Streptomyces niveiscabiei]|uniref:hypothetical protein n=1 Tax=Streptomyces niveiscabiei TaxID=164115 RepID=UPI0029B7982F|nr:hypothetical protein [Streptomyces niveiscabiei]MDX3386098.1 hypothetical protein [Streptomyces niveiscabiei]